MHRRKMKNATLGFAQHASKTGWLFTNSIWAGLENWANRLDRLASITLRSKNGNRILAHLHANIFDRLPFNHTIDRIFQKSLIYIYFLKKSTVSSSNRSVLKPDPWWAVIFSSIFPVVFNLYCHWLPAVVSHLACLSY